MSDELMLGPDGKGRGEKGEEKREKCFGPQWRREKREGRKEKEEQRRVDLRPRVMVCRGT